MIEDKVEFLPMRAAVYDVWKVSLHFFSLDFNSLHTCVSQTHDPALFIHFYSHPKPWNGLFIYSVTVQIWSSVFTFAGTFTRLSPLCLVNMWHIWSFSGSLNVQIVWNSHVWRMSLSIYNILYQTAAKCCPFHCHTSNSRCDNVFITYFKNRPLKMFSYLNVLFHYFIAESVFVEHSQPSNSCFRTFLTTFSSEKKSGSDLLIRVLFGRI